MKSFPKLFKRLGLVVALLALLVVVPQPGAAQLVPAGCDVTGVATLSVAVQPDTNPITPITETRTINADISYSAPQQGSSITPVEVSVTARAEDSWATVTVGTSSYFLNVQGGEGPTEDTTTVPMTVNLNRNAPAFDDTQIIVEAQASEGTCVTSAQAQGPGTIKAGFYEQYSARFERLVWPAGQNDQVQIPTTIDNFGNGAITMTIGLPEGEEGGGGSRGLSVTPPSGFIIVESDKQGGDRTSVTSNVEVQTPFKNGYENRRDTISVLVTGVSTDQPRDIQLQPTRLNAVVQTQGVYVPGFEMVGMLAALLGVALVLHHRRHQ